MAVLVMAFGNMGLAQRNTLLKSNATENMLKHYGVRDESTIVPETARWEDTYGTQYCTYYYYDENEFYLSEEVTQENDGDGWYNSSRIQYDYGFSGEVIEMLGQEWDGSDWTDVVMASFSYENDLLSEAIYQVNMGSGWENYMKEVYNYNGDESTVLYWEWNGSTWSSSELYTYTYGNGTIELVIQYMQGGAWQYDEHQLFTLNFDDQVEEIIVQQWNGTSWDNSERTTYAYEDQVFNNKDIEVWTGEGWGSQYHFTYDYDGNGNAILGECSFFDGENWGEGDNDIEMAFGYSANSNSYYGWRVEVEYVDLTGLNESNQAVSFMLFPVPAESEITIQAEGFQKAEVYSLMGQKLMESQHNRIDVGALSSGLYVIKVYDLEGNCATQRFVVK